MTFRKKLMMRNASWHFGSASQQPGVSTHRRGGGGREGGRAVARINFAVSIMNVDPRSALDFRQHQTWIGRDLSRATVRFTVGCGRGQVTGSGWCLLPLAPGGGGVAPGDSEREEGRVVWAQMQAPLLSSRIAW